MYDGDYDINVVNTRHFLCTSQISPHHYSAQSEMDRKILRRLVL